jgi:hypothetical protein
MRFVLVALLAACNDRRLPADSTTTPLSCADEAPGAPFTFHIVNAGQRSYTLTLGCGLQLPITLQTATGATAIAPGGPDFAYCQYSCDSAAAPGAYPCSDCGPGEGQSLAAGSEVDLQWDRRLYRQDSQCGCWRGTGAGSAALVGALLLCEDAGMPSGSCSKPFVGVPFTYDPSRSSVTIPVQ